MILSKSQIVSLPAKNRIVFPLDVLSIDEAKAVKQKFGKDFIVVTPGIRPSWSNIINDDQRRIMTPKEAILNGSDYIVVGRPISIAKDPVEASDKIAQEIEE